jgi:Transcriptional regulators
MALYNHSTGTFMQVPSCLSSAPSVNGITLSLSDKAVFSFLHTFAITSNSQFVYPPMADMAFYLGIAERTIIRSIKALESCGLIEVSRTKGTGNVYHINVALLAELENLFEQNKKAHSEFKKEDKNNRFLNKERTPRPEPEVVTQVAEDMPLEEPVTHQETTSPIQVSECTAEEESPVQSDTERSRGGIHPTLPSSNFYDPFAPLMSTPPSTPTPPAQSTWIDYKEEDFMGDYGSDDTDW